MQFEEKAAIQIQITKHWVCDQKGEEVSIFSVKDEEALNFILRTVKQLEGEELAQCLAWEHSFEEEGETEF